MIEEKIIEEYFDRLFPICRSITGNGVRETLKIISEIIPLNIHEIPSGTNVFDWTVPKEWNINDAYIITPDGQKICDFKQHNLHVVNYSSPIHKKMTIDELKQHLHTLPNKPNAIPYVTSYYKENWGFCITYDEYKKLPQQGEYEVLIDSTFSDGHLTYADYVLEGDTPNEILISTYVCHPSMANNELSGPLVAMFLYKQLSQLPKRKYTYRFVFVPETIGALAYLHKNGEHLKKHCKAGYVITCIGDRGIFHYKQSKYGNTLADKAAIHTLKHSKKLFRILPFYPGGSDERQYCSPAFNLPVGSLMRTPYREFPEYHTSLDNKNFISFKALKESIEMYFQIMMTLESNEKFINLQPYGEPQLGKRGLYIGDLSREDIMQIMYILQYSDGNNDLIDIAERSNTNINHLKKLADILQQHNLLDNERH
ncbi:MAG: putative polysaccharide biosynthesis protein with aminopeptidase-like domain [Bacteroidia bacterium]|nr:MAG: putative polysaccharide biosynthesis protein with aminopeptidase-like domain [Bacteroidia bacterium]